MKRKSGIKAVSFLAALLLCTSALMPVSAEEEIIAESEINLENLDDYDIQEENGKLTLSRKVNTLTSYASEDDSLPASYDLRDDGYSTSVKNQAQTDTCWAHASLASMESNMLKTGLADELMQNGSFTGELDLSEAHMVWFGYCHYSLQSDDPLYHKGSNFATWVDGYNGSGTPSNAYTAAGILASWIGAEFEANTGSIVDKPFISDLDNSKRYTSYAHLQNAEFVESTKIDEAKKLLMDNGALYIGFHCDESAYYSSQNKAYYCPEKLSASHAVTVIGWDDNYSKSNFGTAPSGDGAWLCKNSWGTDWGDNGYFWLSYYDASLSSLVSFQAESANNYDKIYQYETGVESDLDCWEHYTDSATAAANVFTAKADEVISAVSFWTFFDDMSYHVSVYTDTEEDKPISGTLASDPQSGTFAHSGYHTVRLDTPVQVKEGSTFTIVVSHDTTGILGFIQRDNSVNTPHTSYKASYDPATGTYGEWEDISSRTENAGNFRIKSFSKDGLLINEENFSELTGFAQNCDNNRNADGVLSPAEIETIKGIVSIQQEGSKWSVPTTGTGIEKFTSLETFNAQNSNYIAVDLTNNPKVTKFICENCGIYPKVPLTSDYLSSLGLDTSKIKNISGAELDLENNRIIPTSNVVKYTYDCGQGYLAVFTITGESFVPEVNFTPGDVNEDGKIDIMDIIRLNRALFGKENLTDTQAKAADIDGDGAPSFSDSLTIMRYIVKLIDSLN